MLYFQPSKFESNKPCPQRPFGQITCGDTSCQNCGHPFLDVADLDLQYLAGELAILIFSQLPIKSGRRRALLTEEHCQVRFEDLDMDRIREFNTGK